jgi:hypothetical protein
MPYVNTEPKSMPRVSPTQDENPRSPRGKKVFHNPDVQPSPGDRGRSVFYFFFFFTYIINFFPLSSLYTILSSPR